MDPARTAVLGSAGSFIHLYTPLFSRSLYSLFIDMGNSLGIAVHKEETQSIILSFHDTACSGAMGCFAINGGTKLVNVQGYRNTFQES
jgi:hypothetical protein